MQPQQEYDVKQTTPRNILWKSCFIGAGLFSAAALSLFLLAYMGLIGEVSRHNGSGAEALLITPLLLFFMLPPAAVLGAVIGLIVGFLLQSFSNSIKVGFFTTFIVLGILSYGSYFVFTKYIGPAVEQAEQEKDLAFSFIKEGKLSVFQQAFKPHWCRFRDLQTDENTLLHAAVIEEKEEFVKFLLASGCDHTLANKQGETPIHIARRIGNNKMIDLLTLSKKP